MVQCTESTLPVVEIKNTWDDTTNIRIDASSLQTEKDNIEKMDGSSRFENQFMTQKTSIQLPPLSPPPFFFSFSQHNHPNHITQIELVRRIG